MIDQSKRNTLKNVTAIGIGTAALSVSTGVLAHGAAIAHESACSTAASLDNSLVEIKMGTRLASATNDLEVVITNTSSTSTTITAMTPAQINTVRGRFDFDALFKDGDLHLAAGESITVPIQHHAVVLDSSSVNERATALAQSLGNTVSIITDGNSFAATTVAKYANFA